MLKKKIQIQGAKVLIMGFAFKENCPDLRNTRVIDVVHELADFGVKVFVTDPWCDVAEVKKEYGLDLIEPDKASYDAIIVAVAHQEYCSMDAREIHGYGNSKHVVYDLKYVMEKQEVDLRL